MRDHGLQFLADGPLKNQLQPGFLEDLRFQQRMNADVRVVQTASVLGWDEPVSFIVANDVKRVAVQLIPKAITQYFKGFEYNVLSGGDVDAVLRFSGADLHHRGKDCLAIFAHLHPDFYHTNGLWNTLNEAEPVVREWEPDQPGWESIDVPWVNAEGDELIWQLRFYWGRRHLRRRSRLAREFSAGSPPVFDDFEDVNFPL
jgi:hypothetical protein